LRRRQRSCSDWGYALELLKKARDDQLHECTGLRRRSRRVSRRWRKSQNIEAGSRASRLAPTALRITTSYGVICRLLLAPLPRALHCAGPAEAEGTFPEAVGLQAGEVLTHIGPQHRRCAKRRPQLSPAEADMKGPSPRRLGQRWHKRPLRPLDLPSMGTII
jgi:hypothetical protein